MRVVHLLSWLLGAMLLVGISGCERTAPTPPAPPAGGTTPPRTVVLSPALGLLLRDMGLAPTVVGRHGFDSYLPASIPSCGDQMGIDYERLLLVNPTHILTEWGSRELPPKLLALGSERSWTIKDLSLVTLGDARRSMLDIDAMFNPGKSPSPVAAALAARMDAAWARRPGLHPGRVALIASLSPIAVFGPGSCHQEVLIAIGGTPAITEGKGYISMDHEDIARIKPDVFILLLPIDGPVQQNHVHPLTRELLATRLPPGMTEANTRIIDHPECQIPGVPMIRFADDLATALTQLAPR
jgi:ABC-type Fe3+-hydroxamate transport system substrate-binding protein